MRLKAPVLSSVPFSVGVDLVEIPRARAFYRSHSDRLESFLSRAESTRLRASERPERDLAELLASKEAVFKALSLPWMGTQGFRDIRITRRGRSAAFRLTGRYARLTPAVDRLRLRVRHASSYVIAECRPA